MAHLRWRKGAGLLFPDTNVHVGSQVHVDGKLYEEDKVPTRFFVYRTYNRLSTRFLRFIHKPIERERGQLDANQDSPTSVISEAFFVPNTGLRIHVPLHAVDDFGNASASIRASSLGGLHIGPSVSVLGSGGSLGSVDMTACIDPTVELKVLLPWASERADNLHGVITELAQDMSADIDEDADKIGEQLAAFVAWAMPTDPLEGWAFELSDYKFELDANQSFNFSVKFVAPSTGISAFALQATGYNAETSQEEATVSDIVVIEVNDRGELGVTLL